MKPPMLPAHATHGSSHQRTVQEPLSHLFHLRQSSSIWSSPVCTTALKNLVLCCVHKPMNWRSLPFVLFHTESTPNSHFMYTQSNPILAVQPRSQDLYCKAVRRSSQAVVPARFIIKCVITCQTSVLQCCPSLFCLTQSPKPYFVHTFLIQTSLANAK